LKHERQPERDRGGRDASGDLGDGKIRELAREQRREQVAEDDGEKDEEANEQRVNDVARWKPRESSLMGVMRQLAYLSMRFVSASVDRECWVGGVAIRHRVSVKRDATKAFGATSGENGDRVGGSRVRDRAGDRLTSREGRGRVRCYG
jgi:hypothetical protein